MQLICETTVSGGEMWVAKMASARWSTLREMTDWLIANQIGFFIAGSPEYPFYIDGFGGGEPRAQSVEITFHDEDHATLFKMRWAGVD